MIRDRSRRPRGGPNPGRLRATDPDVPLHLNALSVAKAFETNTFYADLLLRIMRRMSASNRRYVRIRLKEGSR